jgi:hypothetical protein
MTAFHAACAQNQADCAEELVLAGCDISIKHRLVGEKTGWQVAEDCGHPGEKGSKLAQKLGQLQPFLAIFPPECTGQLSSSGPT